MMMTDDIIKHQHIRVKLDMYDLARCHSEAEAQFVVRMKLKQAGIPIGPWGTSTVEHGILWWWDDWHVRVVEWRDTDAAIKAVEGDK